MRNIERRLSKRISAYINANVFSGGKTYDGSIENVSEEGVEYLMTSLIEAPKNFTPEKIIVLNFQIPSGETLNLYCEVKWFLRTPPFNKKLTLGMKIIDPPPTYKEFVKTLTADKIDENLD